MSEETNLEAYRRLAALAERYDEAEDPRYDGVLDEMDDAWLRLTNHEQRTIREHKQP